MKNKAGVLAAAFLLSPLNLALVENMQMSIMKSCQSTEEVKIPPFSSVRPGTVSKTTASFSINTKLMLQNKYKIMSK